MKYAQGKSFSVPASAGKLETCVRDGHAFADRHGKCVRCGAKIRTQWGDPVEDAQRVAEPE